MAPTAAVNSVLLPGQVAKKSDSTQNPQTAQTSNRLEDAQDDSDTVREVAEILANMAMFSAPGGNDNNVETQSQPRGQARNVKKPSRRDLAEKLSDLVQVTNMQSAMILTLQNDKDNLQQRLSEHTSSFARISEELLQIRFALATHNCESCLSRTKDSTLPTCHPKTMSSFGAAFASKLGEKAYQPFSSEGQGGSWNTFIDLDMSDLGATLAANPRNNGQNSKAVVPMPLPSPSHSRCPSRASNTRERPHSRPHRDEHVKRNRVSYDGNGGQTPNIPVPAVSFKGACGQRQVGLPAKTPDPTLIPVPGTARDNAPCCQCVHAVPSKKESQDSSLISWLYDKAGKALFGE